MHPGGACIACHSGSDDEDVPAFVLAGTAYPTFHEPDDCNGADGANGARVLVTGANGVTQTLTPNRAGNFFSSTPLPAPYRVTLLFHGRERAMSQAVPHGDCNACHTQQGANGAPGRIVLP